MSSVFVPFNAKTIQQDITKLFTTAHTETRQNFWTLVHQIEEDTRTFVEQELVLYKRDPQHTDFSDSVIANLALFDLQQLRTENGYDQMENLLSDHQTQIVNHRLKHFLSTLYIRYNHEAVDTVGNYTLSMIVYTYKLDPFVIANLDEEYNTFWLQPFIRQAWDSIFNTTVVSTESEK